MLISKNCAYLCFVNRFSSFRNQEFSLFKLLRRMASSKMICVMNELATNSLLLRNFTSLFTQSKKFTTFHAIQPLFVYVMKLTFFKTEKLHEGSQTLSSVAIFCFRLVLRFWPIWIRFGDLWSFSTFHDPWSK